MFLQKHTQWLNKFLCDFHIIDHIILVDQDMDGFIKQNPGMLTSRHTTGYNECLMLWFRDSQFYFLDLFSKFFRSKKSLMNIHKYLINHGSQFTKRLFISAHISHKSKYLCFQDMTKKIISQSFTFTRTSNQSWNIDDRETHSSLITDTYCRFQGSKMIISSLCSRRTATIDQWRFSYTWRTNKSDISEYLKL